MYEPPAMYSSSPSLDISSQEDAGRAVGREDGHRVVVGLGEELAGGDDIVSTDVGIVLPSSPTASLARKRLRRRPSGGSGTRASSASTSCWSPMRSMRKQKPPSASCPSLPAAMRLPTVG